MNYYNIVSFVRHRKTLHSQKKTETLNPRIKTHRRHYDGKRKQQQIRNIDTHTRHRRGRLDNNK